MGKGKKEKIKTKSSHNFKFNNFNDVFFEYSEDRIHFFSKKMNFFINNLNSSEKNLEPFIFEFIDNINFILLFEVLNKLVDGDYINFMSSNILQYVKDEDNSNSSYVYSLSYKYFSLELEVFIHSLSYNEEFIRILRNDNKIINYNLDYYTLKFKNVDVDLNSDLTKPYNIFVNQQALALCVFSSNVLNEKINIDFANIESIVNNDHTLRRLNVNKKIGTYFFDIRKYGKLRNKLVKKEDPYFNLRRCEFSNMIKTDILTILNNKTRFDNIKLMLLKINLKIIPKKNVSISLYSFYLYYLYFVKLFANDYIKKNKLFKTYEQSK